MAELRPGSMTAHAGTPAISMCEVRFAQAWNLRGDAGHAPWRAEVRRAFGIEAPLRPNSASFASDRVLLWLGPRSWLWLAESPLPNFGAVRDGVNAVGGAVFDVSASYVMWRVTGNEAARVLNRMCPLDFHDTAFPAGACAQSLLGHIGVIVYRPTIAPAWLLLVARSFAADGWSHIRAAAASEGHTVGPAIALTEAQS